MNDASADPLAAFRAVNRDATINLAGAAVAVGVKRFIFLSSVKAAVDETGFDPVDETTPPAPASPYGISKLEAETTLLAMPEIEIVVAAAAADLWARRQGEFSLVSKNWRGCRFLCRWARSITAVAC